ncbi:hypothetical protein [Nakamurella endophytica]|uniref:Uncharacterized protein n=1 Tax=Nakamurella endophytica TaxID=1748367 RepID=A0A917SSW6_9ACTN|nr:hypothetical protein [Nakamurella endophytica]GGL94569.1 hypothetical protein GCM10011594_12950 [Nakamurella endophytica]
MLAPASGRLEAAGRCIVLTQYDGQQLSLVWPAGYAATSGPSGTFVNDERGSAVATVGRSFIGTGGYIAADKWSPQECLRQPAFQVDLPNDGQGP